MKKLRTLMLALVILSGLVSACSNGKYLPCGDYHRWEAKNKFNK